MSSEAGQQHPLGIYYKIWILLFVVSFFLLHGRLSRLSGILALEPGTHIYGRQGWFHRRDLHARSMGETGTGFHHTRSTSCPIAIDWLYGSRRQLY